MEDNFLKTLDREKLNKNFEAVDENVQAFNSICDQVVSSYSQDLDDLMANIYEDVVNVDDVDNDTLEKYFLRLTNHLYFMGHLMETLGVYDDLSELSAKETYNKSFIESQGLAPSDGKSKVTVAERQAIAEETAKYGFTVNSIYNRAYKIIKFKIESAQEMVKTLSKVISKRMADAQSDQSNKGVF